MNEPWWDEPNREEGETEGLRWVLRRGPGGRWCGYVRVGMLHPLAGLTGGDLWDRAPDLEVHGGTTWYADHFPRGPQPDGWWIGFDCGHAWDITPKEAYAEYYDRKNVNPPDSEYRTIDYAREQVVKLAHQLANWPITDASTA